MSTSSAYPSPDNFAIELTTSEDKIKHKAVLYCCQLCPDKKFTHCKKTISHRHSLEKHVEEAHKGMDYQQLKQLWGHRVYYENKAAENISLEDQGVLDKSGSAAVQQSVQTNEANDCSYHFNNKGDFNFGIPNPNQSSFQMTEDMWNHNISSVSHGDPFNTPGGRLSSFLVDSNAPTATSQRATSFDFNSQPFTILAPQNGLSNDEYRSPQLDPWLFLSPPINQSDRLQTPLVSNGETPFLAPMLPSMVPTVQASTTHSSLKRTHHSEPDSLDSTRRTRKMVPTELQTLQAAAHRTKRACVNPSRSCQLNTDLDPLNSSQSNMSPELIPTPAPIQHLLFGPLVFPQPAFNELGHLDRLALTERQGLQIASLSRNALFGHDANHPTHPRSREMQLMDMINYLRLQREWLYEKLAHSNRGHSENDGK